MLYAHVTKVCVSYWIHRETLIFLESNYVFLLIVI